MKPLVLICSLSLIANALLIVVVASKQMGSFGSSAGGANSAAKSSERFPGSVKSDTNEENAQVWARLQTGDTKDLVARLRAAGFPASVIRAIIQAQVSELFAARRKELSGKQEVAFWKRNMYYTDPKIASEMRALGREQTKMLKDLLGSDANGEEDGADRWIRQQFGDLPREKAEQAQTILSDYNDLRSEIYTTTNGMMLPEDRAKIALLEKEQRADLAALLTPQEMEEYELRSSNTANQLRSQLATFNPTEAEFRAIFDATRAAEDKYGSMNSGTMSMENSKNLRQATLDAEQAVLSPERFAELKQATDPNYQVVNRLVARLELPSTAAAQVIAIQQDVQQRATAIRRDSSLSQDQRNQQLSALSDEATSKLNNTLTPRGVEAYKQYGGGWLQSLVPRTPPGNTVPGSVPRS